MSKIVYLKKSKLYLAMKDLFPDREICKLKDCTYRFHKGTEWLRGSFCDTEDNEFELSHFHLVIIFLLKNTGMMIMMTSVLQ